MRARIRTVKPEMRQDERYARLSYPARELFNGLITMADDEGRFRALSSAILGHCFPYDDDAPRKLRGWIAEIKSSGMVLFYVDDSIPYGAFRHWKRHQKINRPSPSDLPPPPDPGVSRNNSVNGHGSDSEQYGSNHGSFTEPSGNDHSSPRRRAFRSDPVPVLSVPSAELRTLALCQRLAFRIHHNDPKSLPDHESKRWMDDMRLLVMDRGGGEDAFLEVERIVDWCQADDFWRSNILSPGKLRKQFTQLLLRAKGKVVPIDQEKRDRTDRRLAALDRVTNQGGAA